uniref:Uncharacterized protein n=1 Tax=Psilocybe cubensis TaxID=181762 RepID=A0A8H7XM39_PSICU
MSTSNGVPVGIQDVISASLNSTLGLNFLMGIYTTVYVGTIARFTVCKRTAVPGNSIVLLTITTLYILCFIEVVLQWYFLDRLVLINTNTENSIYWGALGGLQSTWGTRFLNDFCFYALFVVSDGLLIWRCYHVWGRSIIAIIIPSLLLLTELALSAAATIFDALFDNGDKKASDILADDRIEAALPFVQLATAVTTTLLMAYRIHYASRSTRNTYRQKFTRVTTVIVESAAVYSLVMLVLAIITALPLSFTSSEGPVYIALYYVQAVAVILAGLAPTVLVARIALMDSSSPTVVSESRPAVFTHVDPIKFRSMPSSENFDGSGVISIRTDIVSSGLVEEVSMPVMELKRLSKATSSV